MVKTVYIVDDDARLRRTTSWLVADLGYAFHPFASGNDFLDSVPHLRPGCVLLDLRMPDMSGFEVLAQLSDRRAVFPVVLMSGYCDIAIAVSAMQRGAIDVLTKPFAPGQLEATLAGGHARLDQSASRPSVSIEPAALAGRYADMLTDRQLAVLGQIVAGRANKEIALTIGIAPRTVEMHRANLMAKLGVRNFAELMQVVLRSPVPDQPMG